jgi:hypothetical protein
VYGLDVFETVVDGMEISTGGAMVVVIPQSIYDFVLG